MGQFEKISLPSGEYVFSNRCFLELRRTPRHGFVRNRQNREPPRCWDRGNRLMRRFWRHVAFAGRYCSTSLRAQVARERKRRQGISTHRPLNTMRLALVCQVRFWRRQRLLSRPLLAPLGLAVIGHYPVEYSTQLRLEIGRALAYSVLGYFDFSAALQISCPLEPRRTTRISGG